MTNNKVPQGNKSKVSENIKKLKELVFAVKGERDVKTRVAVLADPENLNTMTILTKEQASFLSTSQWLSERPKWGGMFTGLLAFAESIREPNISIGGRGRDDSIRFMGAISESKFLSKLGINLKGDSDK